MQNPRVVLVEPLYQINLGYIARVASNFGIKKLYLVRPRCRHNGKDAIKYSKHAYSLLREAKLCRSIDEATRGCDIVVGTTGLWRKSSDSFFNAYAVQKSKRFLKRNRKVALLMGRDDTGLTKEELQKCDLTIFIPASKEYPVLNISHALAVILYELMKGQLENEDSMEWAYADQKSIAGISRLFWNSIRDRKDIRNKKAVLFAFEHMVKRSGATRKEINAISVALSDKYKKKWR